MYHRCILVCTKILVVFMIIIGAFIYYNPLKFLRIIIAHVFVYNWYRSISNYS